MSNYPVVIRACLTVVLAVCGLSIGASEFQLTSLDETNGLTLTRDVGDAFGVEEAKFVGDIDGDGAEDMVLITRRLEASGDNTQAFVVYGNSSASLADIDLEALATGDGSMGFVIVGTGGNQQVITSVSGAGNFNNDGYDDFIVNAQGVSTASGAETSMAYVIYGSPIRTHTVLDLDTLFTSDGSDGLAIVTTRGGQVDSVAGVGDINLDGNDDILLGIQSYNGAVGIYGSPVHGATLDITPIIDDVFADGFIARTATSGIMTGEVVSAAGDTNGDGYADMLIGAKFADGARGAAYVLFGGPNLQSIGLEALAGSSGYVIRGSLVNDQIGAAMAGGGDFNGDGVEDILLGARFVSDGLDDPNFIASDQDGAAFLVYGRRDNLLSGLSIDAIRNGDGSIGVELTRTPDTDGGLVGERVDFVEDYNGDGVNDLVILAPRASRTFVGNQQTQAGEAYVVFGVDGFTETDVNLNALATNGAGVLISGGENSPGFTNDSISSGDFNGDNLSDITFRLGSSEETVVVLGASNSAPTISLISDQVVSEGVSTDVINFTVSDDTTSDLNTLLITAESIDTSFLMPSGVVIGGSGADRTLVITPVAGLAGDFPVTVSATDANGAVGTQTFSVTVEDNSPPVITLVGSSTQTLMVNDSYSEPGANATDNVDGDVSVNITIDGSAVNTAMAGSYVVTYNVSDLAGNQAVEVTRTVQVNDPVTTPPPSPGSSGGGGGVTLWPIALLLMLISRRRAARRVAQ